MKSLGSYLLIFCYLVMSFGSSALADCSHFIDCEPSIEIEIDVAETLSEEELNAWLEILEYSEFEQVGDGQYNVAPPDDIISFGTVIPAISVSGRPVNQRRGGKVGVNIGFPDGTNMHLKGQVASSKISGLRGRLIQAFRAGDLKSVRSATRSAGEVIRFLLKITGRRFTVIGNGLLLFAGGAYWFASDDVHAAADEDDMGDIYLPHEDPNAQVNSLLDMEP